MMRRLTGLAAVSAFLCLFLCKTALAGLSCPYCHAEFHSRGELKEHIRTAHPDAKRSGRLGYRCRHCGKVFQTPAHGIHHERECPARGARRKDAKPECPDASKESKPDTKPDRERRRGVARQADPWTLVGPGTPTARSQVCRYASAPLIRSAAICSPASRRSCSIQSG